MTTSFLTFANLLRILPNGVVSKNAMGTLRMQPNIIFCMEVAAREHMMAHVREMPRIDNTMKRKEIAHVLMKSNNCHKETIYRYICVYVSVCVTVWPCVSVCVPVYTPYSHSQQATPAYTTKRSTVSLRGIKSSPVFSLVHSANHT